jgi:uncharacterized protein
MLQPWHLLRITPRRSIGLMALVICFVITIAPVQAIPIDQIPNLKQSRGMWVVDTANLLAADTETQLNLALGQLQKDTDVEMAVVTVPDIAPAPSPQAYAKQLFETWKIGDRRRNNGVLLLIAQHERRTEILAGPGLNYVFTPNRIKTLLQTHSSPAFAKNQFDQGTSALVLAMIDAIAHPSQGNVWADWGYAFLGLLIMLVVVTPFGLLIILGDRVSRGKWANRLSRGTLEDSPANPYSADFGGGSSDGGSSGGDSW